MKEQDNMRLKTVVVVVALASTAAFGGGFFAGAYALADAQERWQAAHRVPITTDQGVTLDCWAAAGEDHWNRILEAARNEQEQTRRLREAIDERLRGMTQ